METAHHAPGRAPEPLDADRFREVLGAVPAPVTVVTTLHQGRPHGSTVSAFCSLSLEPPLVIVSLDRGSELLARLRLSGRFGVNLLREGQEEHALGFARKHPEKFDGVPWESDRGLPRLPGSAAWIVCRVHDLVAGGDHVIVTGLVEHAERGAHSPIVYRERAFVRLAEGMERE